MVFFIFIKILIEHSVSKQWRPHSAASDLDLHCLLMSHKKDARLIWVKIAFSGLFLMFFCRPLIFLKSTFSKNSFRNTIRVSNSLDGQNVGPDLGPYCLQKLSADKKGSFNLIELKLILIYRRSTYY